MNLVHIDIGVAIIAKNSVQHIARALHSVRTLARQIVVVDTGSEDNTPEIAVSCGAEVHFHKWQDSFSEARNYALRVMRTEWILQLDADEELLSDGLATVSEVTSNAGIGGATVRIINELDDDTQSEHSFTRLYRNHPVIRYSGAIHEQIAPSVLDAGFTIGNTQLVIRHYGYAYGTAARAERNIALLKKELAVAPNDVWLQYHLAMSLFAEKNFREAEALFARLLQSDDLTEEQQELSRLRSAQSAIALDAPERSEIYLAFKSKAPDREGLRLYLHGLLHGINRNFNAARAILDSDEVRNSKLVNQTEVQLFSEQFASLR